MLKNAIKLLSNTSSSNTINIALIIILSTVLVACASKPSVVLVPQWYDQQSLKKSSYEYIGYGQGSTEQLAITHAKAELAQSIRSDITVVIVNHQVENTTQNQSSNFSTQKISTRLESELSLSDVQLIKKEVKDGHIFVAYKYSNLPLALKIATSGLVYQCTQELHPYLAYTPLFLNIKKQLGCIPKSEVIYKNKNWYLLIGKEMFPLSPQDYKLLFGQVSSSDIDLTLSSNNLKSGELYHINLQSHKKGNLSLLQIFDSGQMQILINNKMVNSSDNITFPDLKLYDGLVAEANNTQLISKDLSLAILCPEHVNLAAISAVTEQGTAEQNQHLFNQLMSTISHCAISSTITHIRTLPKHRVTQ